MRYVAPVVDEDDLMADALLDVSLGGERNMWHNLVYSDNQYAENQLLRSNQAMLKEF